jgi:hypothetical protein
MTGTHGTCPTPNPFSGATCKRRGCPHCGKGWCRSYGAVMRVNLEHYTGERGFVVLVSVTAPGKRELPWSCGKDHVHGGPRGCRVKDDHADLWSSDCSLRLRKLRDAARIAVDRAGLPVESLWLDRVWEPQRRGVPHAHIVCGANTAIEYAAAMRFHAELLRLAPEYGFGKQVHVTAKMSASNAARYLTGYLMGRSGKKGTVRDNLGDPRMPRLLVYVARALTSETKVTMRRLRYARWYFAAVRRQVFMFPKLYGDEMFAVARVCALLERATGPPVSLEQRTARHVKNLRVMRQLAAA